MQTLDVDQLAELLHMSRKTVLNRISKDPESMPPRLRIPNSRCPLWIRDDVEAWLRLHSDAPPKRGRPRVNPV